MEALPLLQQRVVGVDQKRVVKLLSEALFQLAETGEIHHKAVLVELLGLEPEAKTAAVTVHKTAVAGVSPLTVATGIAAKGFAAGVGGGHPL